MKKIIPLILSFATVCFAAVAFTACDKSEKAFTVPEDCRIVTVRGGVILSATDTDTTCEYIRTKINGVEKAENTGYYCVAKGAKIEISVGMWRYGVIGKEKYSKRVLKGYEIDGEFVESGYSDTAMNFTVNDGCHIESVFEYYAQTGIVFVSDSGLTEREYYDIDRYLDADGNVKNSDDVHYVLYNGGSFYEKDSFETDLTVKYFGCIYRPFPNPYFPNKNQYHVNAWQGYVASITLENFLNDESNDKTIEIAIGKSESGKYFVESVACNKDNSDGPYGNLFMGDNFLELYFAG